MNATRILRIGFVPAALITTVGAFAAASVTAAAALRPTADVTSRFVPAKLYAGRPAVTYDRASVPSGSRVEIVQRRQDKGGDAGNVLIETLRVWGLEPHTRYYAYAYTRRCGARASAAGTRAQSGPSKRHYRQNEVWLGFTTNGRGDGTSSAAQYWLLSGQANSVLIESRPSAAPVACVTVAFK